MRRHRSFALVLALLAFSSFGAAGCSSTSAASDDPSADDALANSNVQSSGYAMDMAKMNAAFPDTHLPIKQPSDAYTVIVDMGAKKIVANTHMFTKDVNVIPYADPSEEATVAQLAGGHGDAVIAQYIKPGEVGFMIKHHRPLNRYLDIASSSSDMKENFKLQDTHIGIVVGVDRNGQAGAITINNPKNYQGGAFGDSNYPMVFVKPTFPKQVTPDQQALYLDNIRTMAVLFNTVSSFPGDYNGGDPLGARNPTELRRHVAQMVKAIGGDHDAQAWFSDDANKIYCAELAHVSSSAGILVPLAKQYVVGLKGANDVAVTEADWDRFVAAMNTGWPFDKDPIPSTDSGPNARLSDLAKYKPDFDKLAALKPIDQVAQPPMRDDGRPGTGLAFEPMTMADIIQHFLRTHIPRDPDRQMEIPSLKGAGETVAPLQAGLLAKMEPGLYDAMKLDATSPQTKRSITDDAVLMQLPAKLASGQAVQFTVKDVFDGLVKTVGKSYASYQEFQQNVQPWMIVARKLTGPRDDSGEGLFVPPSLLHTIAQGAHPGGYLGLQYLGHGVHFSLVKKAN